jgi:EKC/KEOPS complex subunit CGI121/TPRKB
MDSVDIKVYGFTDVKNSELIVNAIFEDMRFAVVDLELVCSKFHLTLAAGKALLNEKNATMKTKSISAEILYQLSSSTKINESLKQYGVQNRSSKVAFVFVGEQSSTHGTDLMAQVDGESFDIELLDSPVFLSVEKISSIVKQFKITPQEMEISSLENAVATRIATKDVL